MHVIIVGCGRVGSELARAVSNKGHEVVVIDRDPQTFQRLGHTFRGRTVQGDARDREVLIRAGIETAGGFAAVTPSDEMNLVTARAACDLFQIPNVVARVYDPLHARMFERAGLQTVISSSWSANRIEQLLTHPGITELASVGNGDVRLMEVQIPTHMIGRTIAEFTQDARCQPVALVRGGQARLSSIDMCLEDGDFIVAAITPSDLPHLKERLQLKES